jgi:hypothetical protein
MGGPGAYIAQRANRQREFTDIVAARRIDEDHEIAFARREIKMLDFDATFLASSRAASERFGELRIWSIVLT